MSSTRATGPPVLQSHNLHFILVPNAGSLRSRCPAAAWLAPICYGHYLVYARPARTWTLQSDSKLPSIKNLQRQARLCRDSRRLRLRRCALSRAPNYHSAPPADVPGIGSRLVEHLELELMSHGQCLTPCGHSNLAPDWHSVYHLISIPGPVSGPSELYALGQRSSGQT